MAKSGNRNSSGSETNSGNNQNKTQQSDAPSRHNSGATSRPSSIDTGSIIQRVSNPYTVGFSGSRPSETPQAHEGGSNWQSPDDQAYYNSPPQIDWTEYDAAERAFQAREIANAKQRLENAAIEKANEAARLENERQRAANAVIEAKNARTRDINASRLKKANDPGVVRSVFQKEHKTAITRKPDVDDKRPHCMARPKRGKSGSGKGKGFVPFC